MASRIRKFFQALVINFEMCGFERDATFPTGITRVIKIVTEFILEDFIRIYDNNFRIL